MSPAESPEDEPPRLFLPVEPATRPRKLRRTVRVIMVDPDHRTLLFRDSDPGIPGVVWWVQPGGGIDPGESYEQTAVREVAEETGYVLDPVHLHGPLAHRHVIHGYSDLVIDQEEVFFLARVAPFEVDESGFTPEERLTFQGSRWWTRAEVVETTEDIWPANLLAIWDLVDRPDRWPVDLGDVEESTVPDLG